MVTSGQLVEECKKCEDGSWVCGEDPSCDDLLSAKPSRDWQDLGSFKAEKVGYYGIQVAFLKGRVYVRVIPPK